MCTYIIEPYDADGIAQCRKCTRNFFAHDLKDIYIGDLNHFHGTYCRDCADKLVKDSVSKPKAGVDYIGKRISTDPSKPEYHLEKYDSKCETSARCDACHKIHPIKYLRDVYYRSDCSTLEFLDSLCIDCIPKTLKIPVESVSKPSAPTYNDIIHSLSNALKLADDEPVEADALAILESSIQDIIDELQSQSPSQTPSP